MCTLCADLSPEQIAHLNQQEESDMGGKPSKGTKADRRLKRNKRKLRRIAQRRAAKLPPTDR